MRNFQRVASIMLFIFFFGGGGQIYQFGRGRRGRWKEGVEKIARESVYNFDLVWKRII